MFAHQAVGKTVTTLLALIAMIGASLGAGDLVPRACVTDALVTPALLASHARVDCPRSQDCCCGARAKPRACACHRSNEAPVAPPPVRDDSGRNLELAPWIASAAPALIAAPPEAAAPADRRDFFTSTPRSVQTLLCVWRI